MSWGIYKLQTEELIADAIRKAGTDPNTVDWEYITNKMSYLHIHDILDHHPHVIQYIKWNQLDPNLIDQYAQINPTLLEYYDTSKLLNHNWTNILAKQPSVIKYCDISTFSGVDWCWILGHQPQLYHLCDWSKLDDDDWEVLLTSTDGEMFRPFREMYQI